MRSARRLQGTRSADWCSPDMGAAVIQDREPRDRPGPQPLDGLRMIGGTRTQKQEVSFYFTARTAANAAQRSTSKKGWRRRRAIHRLAKSCDVMLTKLPARPCSSGSDRASRLVKANPSGFVYAAGGSWGPTGPWVNRPKQWTRWRMRPEGDGKDRGWPEDPPLARGKIAAVAAQSGALSLADGVLGALFRTREHRKGPEALTLRFSETIIEMQGLSWIRSMSGRDTAGARDRGP